LKSSAKLIGKTKLSQIAAEAERQLKDHKELLAVGLIDDMGTELASVLDELAGMTKSDDAGKPSESEKAKKSSILIVDDDAVSSFALEYILAGEYIIYTADDGASALRLAKEYLPYLILLDIVMPDIDGYEIVQQLRAEYETKDIPVVFLTSMTSTSEEKKGLGLTGVVDYINKPYDGEIVKLRVRNQIKIINAMQVIENLSNIDALTSIPNRRNFSTQLDKEWKRAIRNGTSLSMIIADIDNFKQYNDTYGHLQGDIALKTVAKTMVECVERKTDMVARWGGEEFVVLLPDVDEKGARNVAEKICGSVEEAQVPAKNGENHTVTVSLGVNTIRPSQSSEIESFIANADGALYKAKENGRNRVEQVEVEG
jgi:diguanylate cyclase (GGDEF)-like protein